MANLRFLHASDLHLGKRFGNLPEDLRGRLREARHTAIDRLAGLARAHDAGAVLLAGDTFDTGTPAPDVLRPALAAMGHHAPLRWFLLPGNHDSLRAAQLWNALGESAPPNVILATEPRPLELADGAFLLPAPCTERRPGRDLTAWFDDAATPAGALRIGLAHGPVRSFSEESLAGDIIAPDRARRAGLDYLALGDWHGSVTIDLRTRYSGTPEPDRFKHDEPGGAFLVDLAGPGAEPQVTRLETGSFVWRRTQLALAQEEDAAALLSALLPAGPARRQTLLRIVADGRTTLAGHAALMQAAEHARPEFALLELDADGLATECEIGDLDGIDRAGALREAAEALLAESRDPARDAAGREIARRALQRLFAFAGGAAS